MFDRQLFPAICFENFAALTVGTVLNFFFIATTVSKNATV